ncbi:hypothetical protein [Halospeciosus flavus]|uniref:hypothetical protein n=1 Tax=Halospeciosus flavus TaxID=3032283 RepID=UPI00360F6949
MVRFPERRRITIGFRSRIRAPGTTITVPETVEGLATAITHATSAHRTTGPDRSFPTMRRHPPKVEFGDGYDIPDAVVEQTPDTGIEVHVPPDMETVFAVAPLAYYLPAELTVEEGVIPHVRAPDLGLHYELGPDLLRAAPALLKRVFWLDCLVRDAGPHGMNVSEGELLDQLDLDAEEAYAMDPDERLLEYLDAPYTLVKDELPEWHLAMHVEPTFEHARVLPFLLDRMSYIYPPETTELEGRELMERSLDDFYRQSPGPIASVDMVKPKLRQGRVHGWMAEGTPIDVFKTIPEAYFNNLDYLGADDDTISVTVVLNDKEMAGERDRVAEIYEERAKELPMDLSLEYDLTKDELATVLEEPNDFVHYIGHCEVDGLRCADGNLSIESIEESNAQTFFLNACGSYYEGLDLVRKGSVAGAVTFRKVLDEQAAKVGTAFARMLVNGFSIERAIRLARRRIMMGKDYAVVGDGTQVITQSDAFIPATVNVERLDSGDFNVRYKAGLLWGHGGVYKPYVPNEQSMHLIGNEVETTLRWDPFLNFLDRSEVPVVYEGEFFWSDEVAERLR